MKSLIAVIIFSFSVTFAQNSNLYIPLNLKSAYEKGTRSYDGKPGVNYWQNRSEYKISAELLPDSSRLIGSETIKYFNNSPDTLKKIVIRLYPNISMKGAPRDWFIGNVELHDGVEISKLKIANDSLDINDRKSVAINGTNMTVRLSKLLPPKDSISINIDWSFNIPKILRLRMGNYKDGEFFIAYWYPQISVYDDIDKWDELSYMGGVEFYNDFNDYDFTIKLPGNYLVWATGELQNPEEIYHQNIIDKIEQAKKSNEVIFVVTEDDYKSNQVTLPNQFNSWHFKASKVTDISFAVSNSYMWDAASVEVEPGRRVLTSAVYEKGTPNFTEAAFFSRATIEYMSKDLPGFPYLYPHVTTFCNKERGGGMETPMMANDGAPSDRANHIGLVFHEIAHTYFPFMMGTNERKYAWMDEGWASFFPTDVVNANSPTYDYYARRVKSYEEAAGNESELPMMVLSYSNRTDYSRIAFYDRPAVAYMELMNLLGKDLFKKCMLEYMNQWQGKHPLPYDFFFTFNRVSGQDLSWFWKPWFFDFGYPDLAIEKVDAEIGKTSVKVKKLGNIPTQLKIVFEYIDGSKDEFIKPASIWKDKDVFVFEYENIKTIRRVSIGDNHIPDVDRTNNYFGI